LHQLNKLGHVLLYDGGKRGEEGEEERRGGKFEKKM
jgi:hypothetical protein